MDIIFGVIGLLIISYSIWIKDEKRQNQMFILGGLSLLIYSIYIDDLIFVALQLVFAGSAALELIKNR